MSLNAIPLCKNEPISSKTVWTIWWWYLNYATKADIKNISNVDTSSFALKPNLAILVNEVDKLDIDKLVPVPVDLSNLSDAVKNDVKKLHMIN